MEITTLYKKNPYLFLLTNEVNYNTMDCLLKKISKFTNVDIQMILSKSRQREIVDARHLFVKLSFDRGYKHKEIRKFIGKKTHSSIIHSLKKVDELKELNEKYQDIIKNT